MLSQHKNGNVHGCGSGPKAGNSPPGKVPDNNQDTSKEIKMLQPGELKHNLSVSKIWNPTEFI